MPKFKMPKFTIGPKEHSLFEAVEHAYWLLFSRHLSLHLYSLKRRIKKIPGRIKIRLIILKYDIKNFPGKVKRQLWNKRLRLWWARLYVRKDELHWTLDSDSLAMLEMSRAEVTLYREDLVRRREIAHRRDFPQSEVDVLTEELGE